MALPGAAAAIRTRAFELRFIRFLGSFPRCFHRHPLLVNPGRGPVPNFKLLFLLHCLTFLRRLLELLRDGGLLRHAEHLLGAEAATADGHKRQEQKPEGAEKGRARGIGDLL